MRGEKYRNLTLADYLSTHIFRPQALFAITNVLLRNTPFLMLNRQNERFLPLNRLALAQGLLMPELASIADLQAQPMEELDRRIADLQLQLRNRIG